MEGIRTRILIRNEDAEREKFKATLAEWCKLNAHDIKNIDFNKAIDYCYKDLNGIDEVADTGLVAYVANGRADDNFILNMLSDRYFLPCKREALAVINKIYSYETKLENYKKILDETFNDVLDKYIRSEIKHIIIKKTNDSFINLEPLADYDEVEYYFVGLCFGIDYKSFMKNRKKNKKKNRKDKK